MSEKADETARRLRDERIQRELDEALADSFPASDPVSIVTSEEEEDFGDAPAGPEGAKPPPPKP